MSNLGLQAKADLRSAFAKAARGIWAFALVAAVGVAQARGADLIDPVGASDDWDGFYGGVAFLYRHGAHSSQATLSGDARYAAPEDVDIEGNDSIHQCWSPALDADRQCGGANQYNGNGQNLLNSPLERSDLAFPAAAGDDTGLTLFAGHNWRIGERGIFSLEAGYDYLHGGSGGAQAWNNVQVRTYSHSATGANVDSGDMTDLTVTEAASISGGGESQGAHLAARMGVLADERLLLFAIGQIGFSRQTVNVNYTASAVLTSDPGSGGQTFTQSVSTSGGADVTSINYGIGAGAEYALAPNVHIRGDYMYSWSPSASGNISVNRVSGNPAVLDPVGPDTASFTLGALSFHEFRIGLVFMF